LSKEKKEEETKIGTNGNIIDALSKFQELELEDVELEIGEIELWIQPGIGAVTAKPHKSREKPTEILEAKFDVPVM